MKFTMIFVASLLLAGVSVGAAEKDHPVVRIIGLLKDLKDKAKAEGQEEAVAFSKFEYWCSTSMAEVKGAISDEKEHIEELSATVSSLDKEAASLEEGIDKLNEELKERFASGKAAKDNRAKEEALYEESNADFTSTIKAMEEALKALSGAETTTEGTALPKLPALELAQHRVNSVVALVSLKATEQQVKTLSDFAGRPEQQAEGDLNKHVDKYDFKSEGVIELLKQLRGQFQDDRLANSKAETSAVNDYNLAKRARDNAIQAAEKSKDKKSKDLANNRKNEAAAQASLKDENADLASDSKRLSDTERECSTKKSEWDERSETRSNEIAAMDTAISIMGKATGVRTSAPNNPVPPSSPVSFVQVREVHQHASDPRMKAVALIRQAAKDAHSKALERMALEFSNSPFDKMIQMVQKMIFHLMDEQRKEDEHKLWCDQELEKSNAMKDDKVGKIEDLNADLKVETAAVSKLTEDIGDAEKMVSDINAFMREATEIRKTGKRENLLAIKDSREAQTAVANAVATLEQFYKDSGAIKKEAWEDGANDAASSVADRAKLPGNPKLWDSPYTQVSDPANQPSGIITVLQTCGQDFAKMEAETNSQEQVDQKEYEQTAKENAIEKARRVKETEMKTAEKASRTEKIRSLQSTKKNTNAELEKTEQYLTDLKPACVNGDSSYDERKASRTKETQALREAQGILNDAFEATQAKPALSFLQIRSA